MQYKIVVDKQSRANPSAEKKEYIVDIEELRQKGDVQDSLIIEGDRTYVIRRLSLSKYGVLSVLSTPKTEEVNDIDIELFEGDNYIYLVDTVGNKFYAEYVIKNSITDGFPTKVEMNTAINQTASQVLINVNQKLTEYSTTVEMNAAINVKADSIISSVESTYATKASLELKVNTKDLISEINASADVISLKAGRLLITTRKF